MFSRKWEFVFMQAEAQYKVDKKRDRLERQILDSQERAFWDVHRPVPGCVNTTEVDFRKLSRSGRPKYSASNNSVHAATCTADCQTHHQHMLRCAMMDGTSGNSAAAAASAAAASGSEHRTAGDTGAGSSGSSATLTYRYVNCIVNERGETFLPSGDRCHTMFLLLIHLNRQFPRTITFMTKFQGLQGVSSETRPSSMYSHARLSQIRNRDSPEPFGEKCLKNIESH